MKKVLLFIFLLSLFCIACKESSKEQALPYFYSYFPLETGTVYYSKVDSIAYDPFDNSIDTFRFYQKDSLSLIEESEYGLSSYRCVYPDTLWTLHQFYRLEKNREQAIINKNNERKIVLTFPIQEGKNWNAYAYMHVTENHSNYRYKDVHLPKSIGLLNFDSTLTVVEENQSNLIEENYAESIYASSYGTIACNRIHIKKNLNTGKIESGFRIKQVRITHP